MPMRRIAGTKNLTARILVMGKPLGQILCSSLSLFVSIELATQVSDSNHKNRITVLQTALVRSIISLLVPRIRMRTNSCLNCPRKIGTSGSISRWVLRTRAPHAHRCYRQAIRSIPPWTRRVTPAQLPCPKLTHCCLHPPRLRWPTEHPNVLCVTHQSVRIITKPRALADHSDAIHLRVFSTWSLFQIRISRDALVRFE
jgi:hypothetical protein